MANHGKQQDEVLIRIDRMLNLPSTLRIQRHKIFKVPRELLEVNKNAYEPYFVSIGPYHRGKDHLKAMEVHKVRFFKMLLQRTKQLSTASCVAAMRDMVKEARHCYAESLTMSTDDFLEMIVLDGCFVVELFHQLHHKERELFEVGMIFTRILLDLMLFENQLPFSVIWKLLGMTSGNDHKIEYIKSFFEVLDDSTLPGLKVNDANWDEGSIANAKHLLDLVRTKCSSTIEHPAVVVGDKGSIRCVSHLLDFVCNKYTSLTGQTGADKNIVIKGGNWSYIPSASELREAGIKFKKVDEGEGRNLFDIKFTNGILEIPTLTVQKNTECLLRNIIVCEQFDNESQVNHWTDFMILMDCLINTEKDVELLCQSGIISSFLGDNAAVATLFNRLGYHVSFSQEKFFYKKLFDDVKKHYHSPWNRSMAKLRHDYFNSPWSFISFLAAVFLLLLTLLQTTFTILPQGKEK